MHARIYSDIHTHSHTYLHTFYSSHIFLGWNKMISAEVPIMFSKAIEIFITELSLRAWIHTEEAKRRTLQVCT